MKKTLFFGLALSTLSLSMATFSAEPSPTTEHTATPLILKPFDVSYTIKASNIPFDGYAESKLTENKDRQWELSFDVSALVLHYSEKSRFTYNHQHAIQPISYEMNKSVFGSETVDRIQFDWKTAKATYFRKNKQNIISLIPGSLDDMSYQAQLRQDLIENKHALTYTLVEKHKLSTLKFRRDGEESLKTPLGTIKTLRLKTVRDNNKRETWIWMAPQWQYLPVKIKQRTGSQTFEAEITKGTMAGKPLVITSNISH